MNTFNDFTKETFGMNKTTAHQNGVCINCKTSVAFDVEKRGPGAIYTPAGLREYGISGLCEHCFDIITQDPDEAPRS